VPLLVRQSHTILIAIGGTIALEDGIERRHRTASSKRWLAVAAKASACSVRWV
jgi:hypothetical protein